MKKYLMTGVAAIAFATAFTSCTHDFEPMTVGEVVEKNYEAAFTKTFGKPDKNHDWGFETVMNAKARTRYAQTEANMWGSIGVPDPVTDAERAEAYAWFSTHKDWDSESVELTDFFVQQVWKGGDVCPCKDGLNSCIGSTKMNWLWCSATPFEGPVSEQSYDHVNNFNAGTGAYNGNVWDGTLSNPSDANSKVFHADSIQLMRSTSSKYWAYNNSEDSQYHMKYKIKKIGKFYYIGFDFEATGANPNQQYEADGYYSDWIIRIIGMEEQYDVRIIAEDLNAKAEEADSENSDWDFNDVVFDVKFTSDTSAKIQLRAAGGTLPLWVGDASHEVHKEFGVSTTTMVNTGKNAHTKTPLPDPFTVTGINKSNMGKDIVIKVEKEISGQKEWVELKATKGVPAAKLAVNPQYEWVDEKVKITLVYPSFEAWISNPKLIWY